MPYANSVPTWRVEILALCKESSNVSATNVESFMCHHAHYLCKGGWNQNYWIYSTSIWNENWIPRKEMMQPYGSISPNPPTLVSELITSVTASWDRQLVQATFIPMDARVIWGISLFTRNVTDFWAWYHEKHGTFTVKSAYNMLVATREGPLGPSYINFNKYYKNKLGQRESLKDPQKITHTVGRDWHGDSNQDKLTKVMWKNTCRYEKIVFSC